MPPAARRPWPRQPLPCKFTATSAAITVFSVLVLLLGDLLDEKNDAMAAVGRLRPAARYALYVVFLLGILLLIPKTTAAPFIYFQF